MLTSLQVCVVGAGKMGADHIDRLSRRIVGAGVSAVVDIDISRAKKVIESVPSAVAVTDIGQILERENVNALLIATPGPLHEEVLLQVKDRGWPILCEKPLAPDSASAWRIVESELEGKTKHIQVGFMRRFDAEYQRLRKLITSGELGKLLMLHFYHRNPETPTSFTNEMLINDAAAHEFDAIRYFTGEELKSIQVRLGRTTRYAHSGQHDPQHVLVETETGILADVEVLINSRFGYQVATQAVFEDGVVSIGGDTGPYIRSAGHWWGEVTPNFVERFKAAYDREVQSWVDAARQGEVGGPTAWDGYAAATCAETGVAALHSGEKVKVALKDKPSIYN